MFMIDELNNKKVGQIAKNDFIKLISRDGFDIENIRLLTSARYSKNVFDVNYPILIEIDNINDTRKGVDHNGVNRYYKDPVRINNHYYLVTSQWYEKSKIKLINWIEEKNDDNLESFTNIVKKNVIEMNTSKNIDYPDRNYTNTDLFDFLKELDFSLYLRMCDAVSIVKSCSLSSYSVLQSYCESLCKFVNDKEKILEKGRIALGNFCENKEFCYFLYNNLKLSNIPLISDINKSGNTFKHENIIKFDSSTLNKYFRFLYEFSIKCFNYYCKSNISVDSELNNIIYKEKVLEIKTNDIEYKNDMEKFEKRKELYSREEKLIRCIISGKVGLLII